MQNPYLVDFQPAAHCHTGLKKFASHEVHEDTKGVHVTWTDDSHEMWGEFKGVSNDGKITVSVTDERNTKPYLVPHMFLPKHAVAVARLEHVDKTKVHVVGADPRHCIKIVPGDGLPSDSKGGAPATAAPTGKQPPATDNAGEDGQDPPPTGQKPPAADNASEDGQDQPPTGKQPPATTDASDDGPDTPSTDKEESEDESDDEQDTPPVNPGAKGHDSSAKPAQ